MSSRTRAALLWLAFPIVIVAGAGAGYLTADRSAPAPPGTTAVAGHDHGEAAHEHGTQDEGEAAHDHGDGTHDHPDTAVPRQPVDDHGDDRTTHGHGDGGSAGDQEHGTQGHPHGRAVAAPTDAARATTLTAFGTANAAVLLTAWVLRRRVRQRQDAPARPTA